MGFIRLLFIKLDSKNSTKGIVIESSQGEACSSTANYTVTWELRCNPNIHKGHLEIKNAEEFNPTNCHNRLIAESAEACPLLNFYAIWNFLQKYSYFFAPILIIIGLFLTFLGAKIFNLTVFLVAVISTVGFTFIFLFQFILPSGAHPNIVWVVLGIGVVLGIIIGWFLVKYDKLFHAILGGCCGYLVGILLYNLVMNKIEFNPTVNSQLIQKAMFWGTIIICIVVCALLAYYLVAYALIIATSFIGSYSFIRVITLFNSSGYFTLCRRIP